LRRRAKGWGYVGGMPISRKRVLLGHRQASKRYEQEAHHMKGSGVSARWVEENGSLKLSWTNN
jgi:hypothetical protein